MLYQVIEVIYPTSGNILLTHVPEKKATNFCYGTRHKILQMQPDMQADLTLVYFDLGDTLGLKEAWMKKLQCRIYDKPQERTQTPGDLEQAYITFRGELYTLWK